MRAKEVRKILGITEQTLYNYTKAGKLKYRVTGTGWNDYDEDSVYEFLGYKNARKEKINVSYSRVSTQSQKEQLKEQTRRIYESCIVRNIKLSKQYEDIKSGMDSNRKDFLDILSEVIKGNIGCIVIENKDRLIRFGFDLPETIFKKFGTTTIVLNDELDNKSYEQELTECSEDLISIIHYFTMKSYSHRRKLNKLRKLLEDECKNNKN